MTDEFKPCSFRPTVPTWRRVFGVGLALVAGCVLISESWLWGTTWQWIVVSDFEAIQAPHSGDPSSRALHLKLFPGKVCSGETRWSAGSKTYSYMTVELDGSVVFDFWGTDSIVRHPIVWVEPERADRPSRILTYQPYTIPSDTPLGEVKPGFLIWSYDGTRYQPLAFPMCPLNLILRNPLPFQD